MVGSTDLALEKVDGARYPVADVVPLVVWVAAGCRHWLRFRPLPHHRLKGKTVNAHE